MKIIKSNERLYSFNYNGYCGVLLPEKVMKKIMKLFVKYTDEIKKVLYENKQDLYEYHWTLANKMNGDKIEIQKVIIYTTKSKQDLDNRLSIFQAPKPKYEPEVFIVENRQEAEEIAKLLLEEELALNENKEE
ncbi:MAG: hypothetical protein AB1695_12560 [Stygiobacter sp.]